MFYYNENDPIIAAWLKELIVQGQLPMGDVDERSIEEVTPDDVNGYSQCHFFAGIGGWPLAIRLAGLEWAEGIWTGSCPCQPFSNAGQGKGKKDERHLWPVFHRLIHDCKPDLVFGEQVAGRKGLDWLDDVFDDLEGSDYAQGAAVIPANTVGAPHRRPRIYWAAERMGYSYIEYARRNGRACFGEEEGTEVRTVGNTPSAPGSASGVAHPDGVRREGGIQHPQGGKEGLTVERGDSGTGRASTFWSDCQWVPCKDGKARPIEPGSPPLAHGLSERVVRLRGYGNAVVPQIAAKFIEKSLT